jgi:hypothetical protein
MYTPSSVPLQRLPLSKKGKEWRENNLKYLVSKYQSNAKKFDDMRICTDLYHSIYDEEDIRYVTNPFKVKEGFPASPHNFNIIKPKIDKLVGELSKLGDSFKVFHTGEDAVSLVQEKKIQSLKDYISAYVMQNGMEPDEEEKRLSEIDEFFKGSYVDEGEEAAYHTINFLKEKLDLETIFTKGFKDGLITNKEIYYCGIVNGEPYVEKVNPYYLYHDEDPDLENIEEGDSVVYKSRMSLSSIHDRLGDLMTDDQFRNLEKKFSSPMDLKSKASDVNYAPIMRSTPSFLSGEETTPDNMIDVFHVCWRSQKKIGFLSLTDPETNEETVITVDETYEVQEGENIEWKWVTEIWEGYYINDDLLVGIQPIENQEFSVESPNSNKLPYIGSIYNGNNSIGKSLVGIMKPLQYMYIIVWYRLELALARDKGRVLTMDVTQIPKSMGIDIPEFMHYLSSMGVAFINPYEEGWDIPGREGGKPAQFQTFSSQDLTMGNVLSEYVALLAKIEEMISEVSGVSRQRMGQTENRETKGGIQMSVNNSSDITWIYVNAHNSVKKRLLNYLLNCAKIAWSRSGKKKLYYIMDDSSRAFIDLNDSFLYSDFGIFITDSLKENNNIELLKNLIQPAMQNGATLLDAANILTSNSLSLIKNKLRDVEARRQDAERRQAEAEQANAEQTLEMQMQNLRLQEEDSIRKAETSIQVALIQANSSSGEQTSEPSDIDYAKLDLEREKLEKDSELKRSKLEEDKRKNRTNEELKDKQLRIQSSKKQTTSK